MALTAVAGRADHAANAPNQGRPPPIISPRTAPAHRITSDAEAIAVARQLAVEFADGALTRDHDRLLPLSEIDRYSQSGLWGLLVPRAYGGPEVSHVTLAEVTAIISQADANIGQIPQNHHYMVEALRLAGTKAQKQYWFRRVLDGDRLGNAYTEIGTRTPKDFRTRLTRDGDHFVLEGQKFYSTGALFAHVVVAVALDEADRTTLAFLELDTPGVRLIDDWSGIGQRTTGSGTTLFDRVRVEADRIVPHEEVFERPTPMGPIAQLLHAAIDTGIARAALSDTIAFTRRHARPWFETTYQRGADDPHVIAAAGELVIRVHAADALLERAGRAVDAARDAPSERSVAEASVAVAEAKALATETSLHVGSKLFELAGSRATLEEHGFDRHWRNARTHTLHDPVRYKYVNVGNFYLNQVLPPRHGAL